MNEFEGKTKKQLEIMLIGLESYKQGCFDFFKIQEEIYFKTMDLYNQKVKLCKEQMYKSD